jgi:hypothetical protein
MLFFPERAPVSTADALPAPQVRIATGEKKSAPDDPVSPDALPQE